ncbi:MAG TPA: serine--tRNA ligase [Gammaproteobacteria bacterium]|nr:serine--tRNA ligase [Gammaproteobacteria bacterium]
MLDIKLIRENPELIKKSTADKQMDPALVDKVLELDEERRSLIQKTDAIRKKANAFQSEIKGKPTPDQIMQGKKFKEELSKLDPELAEIEKKYQDIMLQIPNPAASDVPIGKDESGNVEVKKAGEIKKFDFTPLPHEQIAENLDLYDSKRAVGIGGTRAYFLKGDLVLLEQAVLNFAIDFMTKQEFIPMTVPWMVNKEALWGTGYFPWGIEDHYTTQDGQGLIGTSEVSITAYHQNEVLDEKNLPLKYIGISPCFRREVGTYGKDTKGFIRVHQFNKVEQVVLTIADEEETSKWHKKMLGFSEQILQELGLPYRVLLMCTGDMGAGQRKKYDIETWFPSQNKYRETHSASYFNDFQSRRLNIKYHASDGTTKYVYTLNNTVVATPRLLGAILENYQQKDGSIIIPEVLQKYMNKKVIKLQK